MKRYSNNAPLIFGIIFFTVGILVQQIGIVLLFGVLPIVISVLLHLHDRKDKYFDEKTGKKPSKILIGISMMIAGCIYSFVLTDLFPLLSGIASIATVVGFVIMMRGINERRLAKYVRAQISKNTSSGNSQKPKDCCCKCGVDLSLLDRAQVRVIDGNRYCNACGLKINEEIKQLHIRCCECGTDMPMEYMHIVDDKIYCHACFIKKFAVHDSHTEDTSVSAKEDVHYTPKKTPMEMIKSMFAIDKTFSSDSFSLKTQPIFVIVISSTELPLCYIDALCIYTSKSLAEMTLDEHVECEDLRNRLSVKVIEENMLNAFWGECYCAGYKHVLIDNQVRVGISRIPQFDQTAYYGSICPSICNSMIFFKETETAYQCEEKQSGEAIDKTKKDKLAALEREIVMTLVNEPLLLPGDPDGEIGKMVVPVISFPNGTKCIGLFTDQFAINRYYGKNASSLSYPNLLTDQYNEVKDNNEIYGIVINPGREEFVIQKTDLSSV